MSVRVFWKYLCLKTAVNCLLDILTSGKQWKIGSQLLVGWLVGWLRDLSIYLLSLPPSSCSFTQSGHNLQMAILSNGYRSFIPSFLCDRYLQESIRKWVHYKRPQPQYCRWMARSKPASLQLIYSLLMSCICILLGASIWCVMKTFWCEIDCCNFNAVCHLLSVWHIPSLTRRIT